MTNTPAKIPPLIDIINEAKLINLELQDRFGEIDNELEKKLIQNKEDLQEKVDNYYYRIETLKESIEFLEDQKKIIDDRIQKMSNEKDRLLDLMKYGMQTFGIKKISGHYTTFTLSESKGSVVITDESKIPAKYLKETVSVKLDKTQIAKDIESGVSIEGCHIEKKQYLRSSFQKTKTEMLEQKKD